MSKFTATIKKARTHTFKSLEDVDMSIKSLQEMRDLVVEAVKHYGDRELLNDFSQPWYSNARDHYETKLETIDETLDVLKAKKMQMEGGI